MIYGFLETVKEDYAVLRRDGHAALSDGYAALNSWIRSVDYKESSIPEQQLKRVQVAAFRMLATFGMAIGGLWTLSIITFVVTFPIKILFKLTLAVSLYAFFHDVFILSQNYNHPDFRKDQEKPWLFGLATKKYKLTEEELANKLTPGTYCQPAWMWLYLNRNAVLPAKV